MTSKKKENLTQTTEALAVLGNRLIAVSEWNLAMVMHFDRIGVNEEESPDIEYASKNIEDLLKSLESQLRDVSEMRDKALGIEEGLGIEAHALLSIVYRYYDRAVNSAREWIGKNDEFAVRMIAYAYQRSHEVSNPAVEVLGAKLVARSQFLEKNRFGVPLPPHGESVYQIILTHQPILGKDIIEKLNNRRRISINLN